MSFRQNMKVSFSRPVLLSCLCLLLFGCVEQDGYRSPYNSNYGNPYNNGYNSGYNPNYGSGYYNNNRCGQNSRCGRNNDNNRCGSNKCGSNKCGSNKCGSGHGGNNGHHQGSVIIPPKPMAPPPPAQPPVIRPSCPGGTTFDGRHCKINDPDKIKPGHKGTVNACPKGMWLSGDRCVPN